MLLLTMLVVLIGATVSWNHFFVERSPPADWYAVREWIRDDTPTDAQFLTTGGENFRTVAFRSAFGRDYGGLSWVAPLTFDAYEAMDRRIALSQETDTWNIAALTQLASEWGADYLVTQGAYTPGNVPLHVEGSYAIFRLP